MANAENQRTIQKVAERVLRGGTLTTSIGRRGRELCDASHFGGHGLAIDVEDHVADRDARLSNARVFRDGGDHGGAFHHSNLDGSGATALPLRKVRIRPFDADVAIWDACGELDDRVRVHRAVRCFEERRQQFGERPVPRVSHQMEVRVKKPDRVVGAKEREDSDFTVRVQCLIVARVESRCISLRVERHECVCLGFLPPHCGRCTFRHLGVAHRAS